MDEIEGVTEFRDRLIRYANLAAPFQVHGSPPPDAITRAQLREEQALLNQAYGRLAGPINRYGRPPMDIPDLAVHVDDALARAIGDWGTPYHGRIIQRAIEDVSVTLT